MEPTQLWVDPDQDHTAQGSVAEAGVAHGATARVRIGLSTSGENQVHPCGSVVEVLHVIREASPEDAAAGLNGTYKFRTHKSKLGRLMRRRRGVLIVEADLHPNGSLNLTNVDVKNAKFVEVDPDDWVAMSSTDFRPQMRRIMARATSVPAIVT